MFIYFPKLAFLLLPLDPLPDFTGTIVELRSEYQTEESVQCSRGEVQMRSDICFANLKIKFLSKFPEKC